MRVAVVGPAPPLRGGIAQHTGVLARALSPRHEVVVHPFARQYPRLLFPGRSQIDPAAAPLSAAEGVPLDPYRPSSWRAVAQGIAAAGCDLVLVQWWHPWFAPCTRGVLTGARRAAPECARIVIAHNVLPHAAVPLQRVLAGAALRPADLVIVHAEREAERARALLPGARIHRMDLPCLAPPLPAPDRAAARQRLGLTGEPLVLFFGLVRPYKGLEDLVDAMALLRTPRARLLIAGEFYEPRADTERRIARLGLGDRVILRDRFAPAAEVPALFAAADVVALPYRSATQSAVLPLAIRYRRPFVATDVGGLAAAGGGLGELVPPRQPAALASALDAVLQRPPPAEAQFAAAESRFGADRLCAGIEAAAAITRAETGRAA